MKYKTLVTGFLAFFIAISPLTKIVTVHAQDQNIELHSFTSKAISEVFPDENLAKAVAIILNNNEDTSFVVTQTQLEAINTLNVEGREIRSLEGLEYLINLKHLDASFNQITNLYPISNLDKLEYVNLKHNIISDMEPLIGLTQLFYLNLEGNQIQNIGLLSEMKSLSMLDLSSNKVSDISSLRHLILLNNLVLNNNQIEDVEPLANLRNLSYLELNNNRISDISPLHNVYNNLYLFGARNQTIILPEVTIGTPTSFILLNHQGAVPNYNFTMGTGQYDVSNRELLWNTTGENRMVWSEREHNGVVIQHVIADSNYKKIHEIFPDENLAKSIAMKINNNEDINAFITKQQLAAITDLYIIGKEIKDLTGITYLINLLDLFLQENQLEDISPLENLYNLQYLSLIQNQIDDIEVLSTVTNLRYLDLSSNKISDVTPLAELSNLRQLRIDNNHISDISSLHSMFFLSAVHQEIHLPVAETSIPFDFTILNQEGVFPETTFISGRGSYSNGQLLWRTVGENEMTWRGPDNFTGTVYQSVIQGPQFSIAEIFPDENLAQAIAILLFGSMDTSVFVTTEELETISFINIQGRNVRDLTGMEYLYNLSYFSAMNNQISDISILAELVNLEHLYINNNQIEDLGVLSELSKLSYLDLRSNKINDISPLKSLINIQYLELDNNQISDVTPLTNLTNIRHLYLNNNQISDISSLLHVYNNARNFSVLNQTVYLPEGNVGILTEVTLLDQYSNVPMTTAVVGNGIYVGTLGVTWITTGENQMQWKGSDNFSGTLIQTVH